MTHLSAVVVSFNEGHLLRQCLGALGFCDEVVVVDLESVDETRTIAESFGARVVTHPRVNHVEIIHAKLGELTTSKWVLLLDPDEVIPIALQHSFRETLCRADIAEIGIVRAPWKFYFAQKPLAGTVWGGDRRWKDFLINRDAVEMTSMVHQGRKLRPGFRVFAIELSERKDNAVMHYWMSSYQQLLEKHRRYLSAEGQAMYTQGLRHRGSIQVRAALSAFKECYLDKDGYKDGLEGLYLSLFWSWYTYRRWDSLKSFQNQQLVAADVGLPDQ